MRFAHLKTHHRFERMRLRGFSEGAGMSSHLAAIVQNLKTLASRLWRPPPNYTGRLSSMSLSGSSRCNHQRQKL